MCATGTFVVYPNVAFYTRRYSFSPAASLQEIPEGLEDEKEENDEPERALQEMSKDPEDENDEAEGHEYEDEEDEEKTGTIDVRFEGTCTSPYHLFDM